MALIQFDIAYAHKQVFHLSQQLLTHNIERERDNDC